MERRDLGPAGPTGDNDSNPDSILVLQPFQSCRQLTCSPMLVRIANQGSG